MASLLPCMQSVLAVCGPKFSKLRETLCGLKSHFHLSEVHFMPKIFSLICFRQITRSKQLLSPIFTKCLCPFSSLTHCQMCGKVWLTCIWWPLCEHAGNDKNTRIGKNAPVNLSCLWATSTLNFGRMQRTLCGLKWYFRLYIDCFIPKIYVLKSWSYRKTTWK